MRQGPHRLFDHTIGFDLDEPTLYDEAGNLDKGACWANITKDFVLARRDLHWSDVHAIICQCRKWLMSNASAFGAYCWSSILNSPASTTEWRADTSQGASSIGAPWRGHLNAKMPSS